MASGGTYHIVSGGDLDLSNNLQGSNHLLTMVMEPKFLAEEVIGHPNHPLTR